MRNRAEMGRGSHSAITKFCAEEEKTCIRLGFSYSATLYTLCGLPGVCAEVTLESAWREVDGIPIPQSEPYQLQIMKEIHERA